MTQSTRLSDSSGALAIANCSPAPTPPSVGQNLAASLFPTPVYPFFPPSQPISQRPSQNPTLAALEFWPSHTPVTITADPDKLKQVLINLVTNACEAVSDGDRVHISVVSRGRDRRCLQVHNGGRPIHPEQLAKLTEPFFTTKATWTGLGLAIVQRIIDAHAGSLKIESSATAGTTVTVTLPSQR
jgi:signal transduction histidine kinase